MATRIELAWRRLQDWYQKNLPPRVFKFKKGASAGEIRRVEKHLGVALLDEVKQSYLICNGLEGCGLSYFGNFNSLSELVSEWDLYRDNETSFDWPQEFDAKPDPAIRRVYWNRLRVPLTDNHDGNGVFLDLDPSDKGKVGQVVFLDRLRGPLIKLGDSLSEWLDQFGDDLEAGNYVFDEDAKSLIPKNQL